MEQWLFELLFPFRHIELVRPVSHSKKRLVHTATAHWIFETTGTGPL